MRRTSSNSVRHDAVPLETVLHAAREWAKALHARHAEIVRIGCFGSYARGDYAPGSDFDVLIEVTHSDFARRQDRAETFQPDQFPVGLELFIYTTDELKKLRATKSSFLAAAEAALIPLP